MSIRENLKRYYLIINRLRRKDSTFKELDEFLQKESEWSGYNLRKSKRTIQRDIEDINSIFDLSIHYNFKQGVYTIANDEGNYDKNIRMVETLDLFNALKITENISSSVHFEKRSSSGTENLNGLLHAIQNLVLVSFLYNPFKDEKTIHRIVKPYALKEFKNRWYLIAHDPNDNHLKVYALDRLTNLEITNNKFLIPTDFNVEDHFKYSFGIMNTIGNNPQKIILSFEPLQGKYIKSLPLHHTQVVISESNNELRIKLYLVITYDFVMEILSFGSKVKIIEPQILIDEIKKNILDSLEQYPGLKP
jgi:predicted DNA-binding transcriptional regulator YafY